MSSFISPFRAWLIAAALLVAIEAAIYLVTAPKSVRSHQFLAIFLCS